MKTLLFGLVFTIPFAAGCGLSPGDATSFASDGSESSEDDESTQAGEESGHDSSSDDDAGAKFDTQPPDLPPPGTPSCTADDLDELGEQGKAPGCSDQAPAGSWDPVLEWAFPENDTSIGSAVIPLVVNMTDDNDDAKIDMCDVPDVVLLAGGLNDQAPCTIYVIDGNYGETGSVHYAIDDQPIGCVGSPAVGDIDGDGEPEIVTPALDASQVLLAFDTDGSPLWVSDPNPYPVLLSGTWQSGAVSLADLDGDGTVEIVFNHAIYDAQGHVLWAQADKGWFTYNQSSVAADLDLDGDLEVIQSYSAHDYDDEWNATKLWDLMDAGAALSYYSIPQVANFDDDPQPEILLSTSGGYMMLEHDGTPVFGIPAPQEPPLMTGCDANAWTGYMRPASVVDFDGDGAAEVAVSACDVFALHEVTPAGMVPFFQTLVQDYSGGSGSTAFDFLGDGTPEPVYSDEISAYGWSWEGGNYVEKLGLPRQSSTWMEYPVVADVDNDGSAEVLVMSQVGAPALQVFGDADERWIQARRIWNQHAYSVTNVREDGTIPTENLRNWDYFNTFRANSQIEGGVPCVPEG